MNNYELDRPPVKVDTRGNFHVRPLDILTSRVGQETIRKTAALNTTNLNPRREPVYINTDVLQDREYLGDGVYVGHDNFHLVLWITEPGAFGENAVALAPGTYRAFNDYVARLSKRGEAHD